MNIIGNFIKGVINVSDKITGDDNPIEEQKEVLKNLLQSGKDTSFGKAYGFDSILKNEDIQTIFKLNVPYFDYNEINERYRL
ncbi:GH3 family domain-containing protein [Maribacter arcticus]|uniref:GH3 family domain-containing protein n=2 Tax=Maribacter arcticus TaxID=561365 RepID=UPI0030024A66